MPGINRASLQEGDQVVKWSCPKGHDDEDGTPLPRLAYCTDCGALYEWQEVVQRGPVRRAERGPMPAGIV